MPRYTDDQFVTVLTECKGMMFVAARRLGCDYHTMQRRVRQSKHLQAVITEQAGQVLDTAELKLFQAITTGDLGAIKYILSTKGKDRGYIERVENRVSSDPDQPITVIARIVTVPPSEAPRADGDDPD